MTEHGTNPPPGGATPPPQGQPGAPPPPQGHQPGAHQPMPVQEGLQPPVANLLSYLLGFVGGLIMFLTQRDREVRFHGIQAILLDVTFVVGLIVLTILSTVLGAIAQSVILALIFFLVWLALLIGWAILRIMGCVQGYQQKHFKMPVIGDFAERWAGGGV